MTYEEEKRIKNIDKILKLLEKEEIDWEEKLGKAINLNDVKYYLKQNILEGCACPACSLNVKLSPNVLTRSLVLPMAILYDIAGRTFKYVHKDEVYKRYGAHPNSLGKLTLWGYTLQGEDVPTSDGNKSYGMYAVTTKGFKFLTGEIKAPKTIFTFNKKKIKPQSNFKQEYVYYQDVVDEYFSFNKHVKLINK